MEDSPSFSLGLTQLDTNSIVGFVPEVFDYEEPNFDENISKFRNDPNKMKEIRKAATKKSKKIVGKSSRLSKKDDSGRPRLPKDVEGCSEDNVTASLDALVEFVVNHNSDNTNIGTSTTVHVHNDHMDVERASADIRPATLECLVAAVENLKPDNGTDNGNDKTSTMQVDYSSTLSELIQVELDVILKVIAAPMDDVPIEVIPPSEPVVDQHNISDSQLPLDFPDVVIAAHQTAKTPAKIAKRIRTRSKIFKSPYRTEYASGSKAIEDQIEEQKHQFTFDGFLISDIMSSGVIEEFKQWVEEGLLKFHAKK
ncbi:hypothetical protein BC332_11927 [Capsicum chinense]|nr:hypothetical protein BC332_11927 [Capsicum chinense]